MKMKRIMGFFLALVMVMGFLPLNPILSYADDGVNIDDENLFPDPALRSCLRDARHDPNYDHKLSNAEIEKIEQLDLNNKSVTNLKGIEYLTNLKRLFCNNNSLKELDVSKNRNLETLECSNNQLTKLDVSDNQKLTGLRCDINKLTSLDVHCNPKLSYLRCDNNELTKLDLSKNTDLTELSCTHNKLRSLDVSNNPKLRIFECAHNKLTSLDVSKIKSLARLNCSYNNLTSLDVGQNSFGDDALHFDNQQHDQPYYIAVIKGKREFKYSKLPGQFKKEEVRDLKGATLGDDALIVNSDTPSEVTYGYHTRGYEVMPVTLKVKYFDSENDYVDIDDTHFPDEHFRDYVRDNFDTDHDGYLSKEELDAVGYILISHQSVSSLQGIEYFQKLWKLYCNHNNLTSLDLSKNTNLKILWCHNNNLTSLDLSKNTKLHLSKRMDFGCYDQQSRIIVDRDTRKFKYSDFPGKFDRKKVTSYDGANFGDDALIVNRDASEVTYNYKVADNTEMNVKLTVYYADFDKKHVKKMVVIQQPTKRVYKDGETLDLTGLKVRLTDSQGLIKEVEFKDFDDYKITVNPKNETPLTVANNNKPVTLTKEGSPATAQTDPLVVNPKVFDKDHVTAMEVTTQPTLSYTEGDPLDLSGLKVTLTDNQTLKQEVEFKDFDDYKITANPKNETPLTMENNNAKVKLVYKNGNVSAETKPLTVNPEVVGPVDPTQSGEKPADISKYWTVTFTSADTAKGTVAAKNTVYVLKSARKTLANITAPEKTAKPGYEFDKWDPALDAHTTIDKDMTIKAYFNPKVVGPIDPTQSAEQPADISKYWTVTFTSADTTKGTVAAKNTVYVLKTQPKTLADITAPDTSAKPGYEFDKWEPALDAHTTIDKDMTIKAYFKASTTTSTPQNPPDPKPQPKTPAPTPKPKPQPKAPGTTPEPKQQPEIVAPKPEVKPQPETTAPKLQPETKAPKSQPEKRSGMIPQTGESTSFAGLLAALGFSITGLAIFRKKKMMKENNK